MRALPTVYVREAYWLGHPLKIILQNERPAKDFSPRMNMCSFFISCHMLYASDEITLITGKYN